MRNHISRLVWAVSCQREISSYLPSAGEKHVAIQRWKPLTPGQCRFLPRLLRSLHHQFGDPDMDLRILGRSGQTTCENSYLPSPPSRRRQRGCQHWQHRRSIVFRIPRRCLWQEVCLWERVDNHDGRRYLGYQFAQSLGRPDQEQVLVSLRHENTHGHRYRWRLSYVRLNCC